MTVDPFLAVLAELDGASAKNGDTWNGSRRTLCSPTALLATTTLQESGEKQREGCMPTWAYVASSRLLQSRARGGNLSYRRS
jgi:hypothetical protein